jgi:hypothetical protein
MHRPRPLTAAVIYRDRGSTTYDQLYCDDIRP